MNAVAALHDKPLRELLATLGADLAELGRVADGLQGIVGILVHNAAPTVDSAAVEEIQRLDYVVQKLFNAAAQVEAIAANVDADWRLPDTYRRDRQVTPSGDLDLF